MEKSWTISSIQIYLKAHTSLSVNGLVVKLWVYKSNVNCSNPSSAAYCYSIYKIYIYILEKYKKG